GARRRRHPAAGETAAAGFVTACSPAPGLHARREQGGRPVCGIAECGVLTALTIAPRFGVLAILPASIPRHRRYFAAMGVTDRLAGEVAINVGVIDLADERLTFARLTECAAALRDQHGADVVVMGCAGMA